MNRRTFSAMLASSIAASGKSWAGAANTPFAFYASIGAELTLYRVDVEGATLTRRSSVTPRRPLCES